MTKSIEEYYLEDNLHPREIAKILKCSKNKIKKYLKEAEIYKSKETRVKEKCEKIKTTLLEKYGVTTPLRIPGVIEKVQKTNLDKYGVTCTLNNKEVDRKRKNSYNIRWQGHPKQVHILHKDELNKQFVLDNFVSEGYLHFEKFIDYFNISGIKGRRLKHEWEIDIPNKVNSKKYESDLYNWIINDLGESNSLYNDRSFIKPLEIDILIPNKLAIEFDGIMYHSFGIHKLGRFNNYYEENQEKYYHLNKTIACQEKGLSLFHIFENEWRNDRTKKIWKSVIRNKLGLSQRIYARKCEIRNVTRDDCIEFLNSSHLQGFCNSSINLGLYYENELVSLMTFGKSRFNKNYQWELLRFCSKIDCSVIGGASRLLKHFIKNYSPDSIISYANRRWSEGNLYEQLGFELIGESKPNYFYFHTKENKYNLYSRNKFQKYKLEELLENYNPLLTETENMYNHGYRKIYDCGNLVYKLSFNEIH